ncbi:MAG: class I SAM-dependent methyltransferase [Bacteroidia bacterium]|nr:class I SAM-dependent methyltransferase [Bacteroidia bacterium]
MNLYWYYSFFPRYGLRLLRRFVSSDRPVHILDIGCGNHSPTITKLFFPHSHYTGLDRDLSYNLDDADLRHMDTFIQMDLLAPDWSRLSDEGYDVILMTHLIEHIPNGEAILAALWEKLKPGGYLYIETPSERSLTLPSMPGTLNFFDDPTHIRLYTLPELCNTVLRLRGRVRKAGLCRQKRKILLLPLLVLLHILRYGTWKRGSLYWDLTGFAQYVLAQKPLLESHR